MEFIVKFLVVSHCSTMPAALVVVSSTQGSDALVTLNVVPVPDISAEGVMFVPDHVFTAAPNT